VSGAPTPIDCVVRWPAVGRVADGAAGTDRPAVRGSDESRQNRAAADPDGLGGPGGKPRWRWADGAAVPPPHPFRGSAKNQ